ncbi:MAG: Txe/YoeB family addiction module toxin [Opitutales bacterium]|nr:Txe/YoeB family addiction module toxin [Opitutales bacterium]
MKTIFKKRFLQDIEKAKSTHVFPKIKQLIEIVSKNPFQTPPPYEKLKGYRNTYSRRINEQHRLVYIVEDGIISFARCWSHYE